MWCRSIRTQLSAYADGELPALERSQVEEHLTSCSVCGRELAQIRRVSRLTSLVPEEEMPSSLRSRITGSLTFAPATGDAIPGRSGRMFCFALPILGGALAAGIVGMVPHSPTQPTGPPSASTAVTVNAGIAREREADAGAAPASTAPRRPKRVAMTSDRQEHRPTAPTTPESVRVAATVPRLSLGDPRVREPEFPALPADSPGELLSAGMDRTTEQGKAMMAVMMIGPGESGRDREPGAPLDSGGALSDPSDRDGRGSRSL